MVLLLAGCTGLPDQRLGREAYQRGDLDTAERNFRQLADLGYVEARLGLADLYVNSGDPAKIQEAKAIYRQLAGQLPRIAARLGRLLAGSPDASAADLHEASELLEQANADGEAVLLPLTRLYLEHPQRFPTLDIRQRITQWRAENRPQAELAQVFLYRSENSQVEHRDEIERICTAALVDNDSCYVDLAVIYRQGQQVDKQQALLERLGQAVRAGRVSPQRAEAVARVLCNPELGTPNVDAARALLEPLAAEYPVLWVSLARLVYDNPGQGSAEQLVGYLDKGRTADLARAELLSGRLYLEGKRVICDPFQAERHLLAASAGGEASADFLLGRIYWQGFLGRVYPDKALRHLLAAARSGDAKADLTLAHMFNRSRGVLPNPVNAWVFAQLAVRSARPEDAEFAALLDTLLTPEQRVEAGRVLRAERDYRAATPGALMRAATLQSH
ncbi:alginate biosynthesis protein AlgK [Betaproteobacteria bacterium]|nr:alginate biosynthesis protein AlgK [Betaproteobacteria bacterium]GHU03268.1 alginate biosynthesis protein AlgK [Betaproteobacteria bacterium]